MLHNNPCAKRIPKATELKIAPFPERSSRPVLVAVMEDEYGGRDVGLVSNLLPDNAEPERPGYWR